MNMHICRMWCLDCLCQNFFFIQKPEGGLYYELDDNILFLILYRVSSIVYTFQESFFFSAHSLYLLCPKIDQKWILLPLPTGVQCTRTHTLSHKRIILNEITQNFLSMAFICSTNGAECLYVFASLNFRIFFPTSFFLYLFHTMR